MVDVVKALAAMISEGGSSAIISILLAALAFLVYDRTRLLKDLAKSLQQTLDAKAAEKDVILKIVDRYHQGNLTMVQAINEIKLVLAAIQGKIQ